MQTDKYTIAWFKIAECVSRGEKERALGVYRLLSHSFNDDALSRQLEADIYLVCNEQEQAIGLYRQAFELYKKSKRYMEAAAVGEHLTLLVSQDLVVRHEIITCYSHAGLSAKIYPHSQFLIDSYVRDNRWYDLETFGDTAKSFSLAVCITIYQQMVIAAHKCGNKNFSKQCIEKGIHDFMHENNEYILKEFLSVLCAIDDELYLYALECIERQ